MSANIFGSTHSYDRTTQSESSDRLANFRSNSFGLNRRGYSVYNDVSDTIAESPMQRSPADYLVWLRKAYHQRLVYHTDFGMRVHGEEPA